MMISAADVCIRKGFVIKTGSSKEVQSFYDIKTKETKLVKKKVDYFIPDYEKFKRWYFKLVCGKDYDEVKNNPTDDKYPFYCRVSCMGTQNAGYVDESIIYRQMKNI